MGIGGRATARRLIAPTPPLDGVAADSILQAHELCLGYEGKAVVHDLDLHVRPGEVVAILGPNGAGKTTTLLGLSGELRALSGVLAVDGAVSRAPLYRRARGGLSFVTEERSVFMGMSTADNLRAARVDAAEVYAMFPELRSRSRIRAGLLSGGEQQMLTLGRAIARKPRLLFADELSLGLAPLVVRRLLDAVRQAADKGCGVVIVEQHVRQALRIADRGYVMRRGRVQMSGLAAELKSRIDEIEANYLT